MRFRLPKPYTILITRTGETPASITLRPLPLILLGVTLAAAPTVWFSRWVMGLTVQNAHLTERNETLTETASEVLQELETLDGEIEDLRERAGLPNESLPATGSPEGRSQGGLGQPLAAEELFSLARAQMPQLIDRLERQVAPALESTLAEEEARAAALPSVKPFDGDLEVSSEFGPRQNPFGGRRYEMHGGIDFRGPIGTPIQATADGVVLRAEHKGGYGKYVVIDHSYGHKTLYAHLSAIGVKVGDHVKRGDVVGALGNTGRSTGPHLHYEVHRDGQAVNPRYYLQLSQN